MDKGYKVVRRVYTGPTTYYLASLMQPVVGPDWSVVYKEGEWVQPKIGYLFYHQSLAAAEAQAVRDPALEVWEVEVDGPHTLNSFLTPGAIEKWGADFWAGQEVPFDHLCVNWLWDELTPTAERIKLIRRINFAEHNSTTR